MKRGIAGSVLFLATVVGLSCLAVRGQSTEPQAPTPIVATIDTQQTAPAVSKYIFGGFIEHIGSTMYSSLWSEMIDDRKFYFPITSKEPESKAPPEGGFRMQLRKWHPVAADEVVVMDKDLPYVGDQSPRIELNSSTPHGILQSGLALVKGKRYTGHIVIRGTVGAHIKVALIWGAGKSDGHVVNLDAVPAAYKNYPVTFTSAADASDARLEITGIGSGSFHVGAVSLMPADNVEGFRPDTIALLRQIKMGFWRFGGNYTSNYIWYDAIGDRDKRRPDYDYAWNAMQTNDLGMDEFMTLCKLIQVDPYISVNAGFGDSHSAAEQVEYINGSVNTRMGAMRAKNGHVEPYHVKFWNIGNEPWGAWQLGRTDTKYFMLKHNEFAKAMRRVDPSIVLIASGEFLEDGNLPGAMRAKNVGNLSPLIGTDVDWTGSFAAHSWGNFDGIAEHWYAQSGRYFDLEKLKSLPPSAPSDDANVKVDQSVLEFARYPANTVRNKAEEWQVYQNHFPGIRDKKIFLSIDEWAYFGGGFGRGVSLKLALSYGMVFNEMLRHTDFLTMAAHTMGTSTLDINPTSSTLNTTGLVFKLFAEHFAGSIPVSLVGNSPQPAPKYPAGGDQPKVNSGSATYPLDLFAALTPDHKFLLVSVVNATETPQELDLKIIGASITGASTLWKLTGSNLDAANHVGLEPQVEIKEIALGNETLPHTVAPISINVYRFPVSEKQH